MGPNPLRAVFMGSGAIALPVVRALLRPLSGVRLVALVTQPDRPVGRHQILTPPPVKPPAVAAGVPVHQPVRLQDPAVFDALAAAEADLFLVMSYGRILPGSVLRLPRLGCINLHASLLPRHRGASPIQAAIRSGDTESGITVMYMDEGLDTGDILLSRSIPIRRRETGASLHDRLAALAVPALEVALELLAVGAAPRTPQEPDLATYSSRLTRDHGRIDWTLDHSSIDRWIRAYQPWPGTFTRLPSGTKLKLLRALPARRPSGVPGEVLRLSPEGIVVACGSGAVRLLEVQPEGGRPMCAGDFLRGHALQIGQRLDALPG